MATLPKQTIPVKFLGLGGESDPKGATPGRMEILENTQSLRTEDGGVEIEKRYGGSALSLNIEGGGTLSAGAKIQRFGPELVVVDSGNVYAWGGSTLAKWIPRGRATSVAARIEPIDSSPLFLSPVVTSAVFGGFRIVVIDRQVGSLRYQIRETATGATLATGSLSGTGFGPRVAVVGTTAFIFYHDQAGTLRCRSVAAATPTTISAASTVASNLHTFGSSSGMFDVIADVTNSRMVVAYRKSTAQLTLMIWTTGMSASTTLDYATEDPNTCIGFLQHDFANGEGYVAVGTSVNGLRCLTFNPSTMLVGTNTAVDAAATAVQSVTGKFSTTRKLMYEMPSSGSNAGRNTRIKGWDGTTAFEFMRSVGLSSKCWTVGTKFYVLANHHSGTLSTDVTDRSLFLLEWNGTASTTGDSGVRLAGFLLDGTSGGHVGGFFGGSGFGNVLPEVSALSATRFQVPCSMVINPGTPASAGGLSYTIGCVDLEFAESQLGAAVPFNRQLHIPCAAAKVYDGKVVYEEGFYVRPAAPTASAAAGGSMAVGDHLVQGVWARVGPSGLIERSAPGPTATVAVSGGNLTISGTFSALRVTEADKRYNINQDIQNTGTGKAMMYLEIYASKAGLSEMFLATTVANDASADTLSFTLTAEPGGGEQLYTDLGQAENGVPPAILAFEEHRDRLVAITGDNVAYPSKDTSGGLATAFSPEEGFFLEFDTATGPLVGLASDGTTLFVAKADVIYPVQGEGPDLAGDNGYAFPSPLPSKIGFAGPRAFVATPDGILFQSSMGKHMLDRGGGIQPAPGADAYDSLTVTGGVTLDDRPMALLTTDSGRTLAWDWQLKIWHTWTNQAAVSSAIWQGLFVFQKADGTVVVETPGSYSDPGSAAIAEAVQITWLDLVRAYLYYVYVIGEAMASCSLTAQVAYDYDATTIEAAKTLVLATSGPKAPWVLEPVRGYCNSLQVKLTESSTTRGVKLTKLLLEVGLLQGVDPQAAGSYFT